MERKHGLTTELGIYTGICLNGGAKSTDENEMIISTGVLRAMENGSGTFIIEKTSLFNFYHKTVYSKYPCFMDWVHYEDVHYNSEYLN